MTATSTRSVPVRNAPVPLTPAELPDLGAPLFVLNLKTYTGHLGPDAERTARLLESLGAATGVSVAVAPAAPDLGRLAAAVSIPVLAQHTDPIDPGSRTGTIPAESLRASGVWGSLVNHSERPLAPAAVADVVRRLVAVGLVPVVCARDVAAAGRLARTRPPYLAVEPPELIGGNRAVSTAKPEVVSGAVTAVGRVSSSTRVLCGAGVHDRHDIARALELGASGVLVASAVTKASDPRAALEELLAGF